MKIVAVLLLAGAAGVPAIADPYYTITFDYTGVSTTGAGLSAPSGSFNYDPTDASAPFSDFIVDWGNATYDLDTYANAPMLASSPPTGCSSAVSGQPYGFALITQNVTGCDLLGFTWSGVYYGTGNGGGPGGSEFFFILEAGTSGAQDEIAGADLAVSDPSTSFEWATGDWTVSDVPEPGAVSMMLLFALAAAGMKTARAARR